MKSSDVDDKEIRQTMEAFEAAVHAEHHELEPPEVQRILLVIDGSNQDSTSVGLAACLAPRSKSHVTPILAWEGPAPEGAAAAMEACVARLEGAGAVVDPLREGEVDHGQRSFDQILAAAASRRVDLVVVDAPYLDDFEVLGAHSIGTNLEVLMARHEVPLLIVRAPLPEPSAVLRRVLLPMVLRGQAEPETAAWAVRLVEPGGQLRIAAVVDQELLSRAGSWIEAGVDYDAMTDEMLAGLREPRNAGIVAALQRHSARNGLKCRVSVRSGPVVETLVELNGDLPHVVVVQSPRDPRTVQHQSVMALVRAASHPVLVI